MKPDLIYHITTSAWWKHQSASDLYTTETLDTEGFIHCSTRQQVKGTLARYYANQNELLLLHISLARLKPELKFEASTNSELYPHVFGKINKDAVVRVEEVTGVSF